MPLRLYLIRHGETEWSLSGRHTGRTDIPLSEQGVQDARKLGQRLHGARFTRALTSPRQRARQTCALAALTRVAESNRIWRNGTMGTTKDSTPLTFAKADRTGISFGTVVRVVKRQDKSPIALIG